MDIRQQEESLLDTGEQIIYLHDRCRRCELPRVFTPPMRSGERRIHDATGDIYVTLTRDREATGLWECDIAIYERNAPADSHPVVTHVKSVGQPAFMPSGVPSWLWVVYSALGEIATHFMDEHDV